MDRERLRQLTDFLPRAVASANALHADADYADAIVRDTRAAIAAERDDHRRGVLIVGPWAAAAAASLEIARRWAARNSASIAAFGGGAAVATAVTLGPGLFDTSPPRPPTLAEPAPPLPPIGHNPPRVGPPKGNQPRPATPAPSRSPRPRPTSLLPPVVPALPLPSTPPVPDLPTPDLPTDPPGREPDGDEPASMPTCRVYLPHVMHRGLLCGTVR